MNHPDQEPIWPDVLVWLFLIFAVVYFTAQVLRVVFW